MIFMFTRTSTRCFIPSREQRPSNYPSSRTIRQDRLLRSLNVCASWCGWCYVRQPHRPHKSLPKIHRQRRSRRRRWSRVRVDYCLSLTLTYAESAENDRNAVNTVPLEFRATTPRSHSCYSLYPTETFWTNRTCYRWSLDAARAGGDRGIKSTSFHSISSFYLLRERCNTS